MVRFGLTHSRIFAGCLTVWLLGLLFPFTSSKEAWLLCLLLLVGAFLFRQLTLVATLFLWTAALFVSNSYYGWYIEKITPSIPYDQREWRLTVLEFPQKYDDQALYRGRTQDGWFMQFYLDRSEPIPPGSTVTLSGTVKPYALPEDPKYWSGVSRKLFAKLSSPKVINITSASLTFYDQFLVNARSRFKAIADHLFVQPYAALFAGILTGLTTDLPEAIADNFRISGLSHLVAVSGFNVTILMALVAKATSRLSRWLDLLITCGVILVFVVFTGASASVVRAGLLAGLLTLGRSLYRKTFIVHLLLITGWVMSVINPLLLRYDVGFQLSFAAVIGLIFFSEPIQANLVRIRLPPVIAELIAATTAAQITTVPIIAHYFGTMSAYSILANLFIGSTVSAVTIFGMPLIMIGWFSPSIAVCLAIPFDLTLRYIIMVAQSFSELPYSQLLLSPVSLIVWACYYVAIGGLRLLWRPNKK